MNSYYKNLTVYYFSGTGNALKSGVWLAEKAGEFNINSYLNSIDRFENIPSKIIEEKNLIAFCFPTHGFNPSPLMLKFIAKFPRGSADVVIINTRGGLKFGKIYFPGLSGLAQLLPMLILKVKGYRIAGALPFDMPSNWVSLHPGLNQSAVSDIINRRKLQLEKFAEKLFTKRKAFNYKFFLYLPLDLAVIPLTVGYSLFARYMLAKSFFASADCNNCRLCENNCPTNSIKIVHNRPFWSYSCESCMRCISFCPQKSIQTAHSFIIPLLYILSVFTFSAAVFNLLGINVGNDFLSNVFEMIVNYAFTAGSVFLFYRLFSLILKIKFVNRLFEYTSFTRYWRRYTAPGVNIKSFNK